MNSPNKKPALNGLKSIQHLPVPPDNTNPPHINANLDMENSNSKVFNRESDSLGKVEPTEGSTFTSRRGRKVGNKRTKEVPSIISYLPEKSRKKPSYVVVENRIEILEKKRKTFLNTYGRNSVTALLPPVERTDGVFKEKILKESSFHKSERNHRKLSKQNNFSNLTIRQKADSFIHEWIPGVTTPEGIVLVAGLAILAGVPQGMDLVERVSTIASTIIVSAVTLGIPTSALSFL